ncbi:MAG: PhnA domain-containing protein [Acidimicrobiia bacterium]|nr:PhnA domain-containing protein [Acidimicrobiia bacterium]
MDANGNLLVSGGTVTIVKDVKVKGSSSTVKVGMRITDIRIMGGDHDRRLRSQKGKFPIRRGCWEKHNPQC